MNRCVRMLGVMFLFGALAISAKAQVTDQITVNVPYSFVVGDKTLPAGSYRVNRVSFDNEKELALISMENKAGVLLVSSETEDAHGVVPKFVFEEIGGQHLLVKIQTVEHVFQLPVSHAAVLEATAKSQTGSASGTD